MRSSFQEVDCFACHVGLETFRLSFCLSRLSVFDFDSSIVQVDVHHLVQPVGLLRSCVADDEGIASKALLAQMLFLELVEICQKTHTQVALGLVGLAVLVRVSGPLRKGLRFAFVEPGRQRVLVLVLVQTVVVVLVVAFHLTNPSLRQTTSLHDFPEYPVEKDFHMKGQVAWRNANGCRLVSRYRSRRT